MAQLSDGDIAKLVRDAGFSAAPTPAEGEGLPTGSDLDKERWRKTPATIAIAVVLAESGGRTDARHVNNDKHKSVDRGLWQINSYYHPNMSDAQADDPVQATAYAFKISKGGTSFEPWNGWKDADALGRGEGDRWLELTDRAIAGLFGTLESPSIVPNPLDVIPEGLGAIAAALGWIGKLVGVLLSGEFWRRTGLVIGGALLLVLAGVLLFLDVRTKGPAAS